MHVRKSYTNLLQGFQLWGWTSLLWLTAFRKSYYTISQSLHDACWCGGRDDSLFDSSSTTGTCLFVRYSHQNAFNSLVREILSGFLQNFIQSFKSAFTINFWMQLFSIHFLMGLQQLWKNFYGFRFSIQIPAWYDEHTCFPTRDINKHLAFDPLCQ